MLCAAIDNEAEPEREDDGTSTVIDTLGAAPTGEPKAPPRHSYPLRYASALLLVTALLGWFLVRVFSGSDTADLSACRTDQGDQRSGAGVIAAFEHAYYVTRSGAAVRALVTPDSPLPLADKIKAGIDSVPAGTAHCVQATPISAHVYSVVIAEMRPGQEPGQFSQTITTKDIDGKWFVDSIG